MSVMHHIDRTLQELENGTLAGEYENGFEVGTQGEYEQEYEQEFGNEFGQEFSQEFGQEYSNEYEANQGENQELEMAYQLLEVTNEQELSQFLGNLMSKAAGAVQGAASRFVASPTGQAVGNYLVNVGQNTLPQLGAQYGGQAGGALGSRAGAALGGRVGPVGARVGGWAGGKLGQAAGSAAGGWLGSQAGNFVANNARRIFNLELEGLSPENQELEIARAYVRFASDVSRRASQVARRNPRLTPAQVGRQVLGASVPQLAPGLLQGGVSAGSNGSANGNGPARPSSGTWVRRGRTLVLFDA